MFFREKKSASRTYLQIVENRWDKGKTRQRVIATLGRLDLLKQSGQLEGLLVSGAKFCELVLLLAAHRRGETTQMRTSRIGAALIFERLWQQSGCRQTIERLLEGRKFKFSVERAVFLTVLHRLFISGSDWAAERWKEGFAVEGIERFGLHHLYRAMACLGEVLPETEQQGRTPFARVASRILSKKGCLHTAAISFHNWSWCFSTRRPCSSKGKAERALGSTDIAKAIGRT